LTLFEEFLLREKIQKSLAAAEVCKARAAAAMARSRELRIEGDWLLGEALAHVDALCASVTNPSEVTN
jgi:hypothetical protein